MVKTKVIVVEDDLLTADMLVELLEMHGYEVGGIAGNVTDALALIEDFDPELAIIDVRLASGDLGTSIIEELDKNRNLGILYATGNISLVPPDADHRALQISKPYNTNDILLGLEILERQMRH